MHIKSKPKFISVSQMDPCRRACPFDLISVMYHIPTRFTNTTRWSLWRNTATNDPFPDPKLPFAWGNFRIYATSWYNPWQTRLSSARCAERLESGGGGAARSGTATRYLMEGLYNTLYSICSHAIITKNGFVERQWKTTTSWKHQFTAEARLQTAQSCRPWQIWIKQQWLFVAHVI